jgi:YggT family protein
MRAILDLVLLVLHLYTWVVIASAIFSWLYAFGVVNPRNQFVAMIGRVLYQLTEPALRPIRRYVPSFGGLDISPVILLLLIFLIERIIIYYIYPNVF